MDRDVPPRRDRRPGGLHLLVATSSEAVTTSLGQPVAGNPTADGRAARTAAVDALEVEAARTGVLDHDEALSAGFDPVTDTIDAKSLAGYYAEGEIDRVTLTAATVLGDKLLDTGDQSIGMDTDLFQTADGDPVTAVTADEMREVDRVAVEEFGLGILQMMENAGRTLAWHVREVMAAPSDSVTVLAGPGGNGGGGLCGARHLANRGVPVRVVVDRDPADLEGPARTQYETLTAMDVPVAHGVGAFAKGDPDTVVDALVGYGLDGPLRGTPARLVERLADLDQTVVSLDVPSGVNATTGERAGSAVDPDRLVTLALPKTGLSADETSLYLADIAIPVDVYGSLAIPYESPFDDEYWVALA